MSALQLDNPFWSFSLTVYAAPGVTDECLDLQQAHGSDVNLLLFAAWMGAERGVALSQSDVQRYAQAVRRWHGTVVVPLRSVRQTMKALPHTECAEVQSLRREIAASELRAEQIEQALLFAEVADHFGDASDGREVLVRRNVQVLLHTYGQAERATVCERLIAAALAARP